VRTDGDLVNAVLDGEREAFADLAARYERAVRATTLAILGDHHAAQDAAQEAFVSAFEKLGRLRDPSAFGGWMISIARNRALTARRQRSRTSATELPTDVPSQADPSSLDGMSGALLDAVMRLPMHERVAVMLRYFDGHSVREVAEIVGRPVGTVTVRLSRARSRLKGWLKEFES
jgi:RNA polymerase sigma-70 factor (ECF subfamily)